MQASHSDFLPLYISIRHIVVRALLPLYKRNRKAPYWQAPTAEVFSYVVYCSIPDYIRERYKASLLIRALI